MTTYTNFNMTTTNIQHGDIYYAYLPTTDYVSHVQQGLRPVLIISNDSNNRYSPTITVIPLTSQKKRHLPVHVTFSGYGLAKTSTALCEQTMTIDKSVLEKRVGHVGSNDAVMAQIKTALMIQMGIVAPSTSRTVA